MKNEELLTEEELQKFEQRFARYDNDPETWGIRQVAETGKRLAQEVRRLSSGNGVK